MTGAENCISGDGSKPLKHGGKEEAEGIREGPQGPDIARTATGASLIQYVRLKFE